MSSKVTYQKLSLHDQILLRPDTYIGSIQTLNSTQPMWISLTSSGTEEKVSFEYRTVKLNDGLLRLVIEVISNAIDNVWRSVESKQTPRFIKITVSPQEVSVWNDGANISTELHETEKIPVPEMIFGNLLTSSNYNDNEERKTSGRNGLGSKACNIFSKSFSVKIFNATERIVYTQEWKDNMKTRQKPVLAKKGFPSTIEEGKNGYTLVTFSPDFSRFGETEFNAEHLAMIRKLVIDAAMTVHFHKVKVFLNGTLIKMDDLSDYVKYYFPKSQEDESDIEEPLSDSEPVEEESGSEQGTERKKVHEELFFSTPESKVLVRPSNGDFMQVSFVNGIQTFYGGVHVENWCEALFRPLVSKINGKKDKSLHIDIRDIKKHFFVFVFSTLDKPTFDSQSKTRLTGPDVKTDVKSTHISKMMKWSFIDKIEESLKLKELAGLKKSTERKKGTTRVEKLDDANFAGGKKSQECSLFISEGDSAKTYVVQGMKEGLKQFGGKGGRDVIGVLPIRGKFLNVKNASAQMLMNNKEVKSLIQALGLQFDVDYTKEENRKKLRYGRLVVSADSDSVTGDTPLLLRKNNLLHIKTIDEIHEGEWIKDTDTEKEYNQTSYEVWTDKGWSRVNRIMKHKTTKQMYRVLTHTGIVDVTEDHSLLNTKAEKITPSSLKVNDELLHSFPYFENTKPVIPPKFKEFSIENLRKLASEYKIPYIRSKNKETLINDIETIYNQPVQTFNIINKYPEDLAWVMGFFWADGTCGVYHFQNTYKQKNRPRAYTHNRVGYSWAISNTNKQYLERSLPVMQKYYKDYEWKIIEDRHNSTRGLNHKSAYKLICNGGQKTEPLINEWRSLFYTKDKSKQIPIEILNSPITVRQSFLEGYLYGDGNKERDGVTLAEKGIKFDVNSKISAQGIFVLCKSLGYLVSINKLNRQPTVYSINLTKGKQQDNPNRIKKIFSLGTYELDVYDLETENHHFQAGVGQMIVHNTDGTHICGLLYNFFQTLFPSLLANNDFFYFMRVPIIKIDQGPKKAPLSFFYQEEANAYINQHKVPKSKIKYYKGLGTANSKDVKEDFARRLVSLSLDDKTNALMDHIFHKDHTGFRKDWLCKYTPIESYPVIKDYELEPLAVPQFLNQELIQFSIDDCRRSIPHLLDGFKESHRKVMYAAFKRNLRYNGPSLKVAQFAGYVAEHSGYHHGENNLLDTITKLAQRFVGSNNIPLLFNDGQFGSRLELGKDAANGRYIFTKMDRHTRLLFREEDESYLPDRLDDGETVEKEYYLPILPMVLVNPTLAGIGTGWSCNVPGFNPKDLIEWIRDWLAGDVQETSLTPWYRGFEGSISVDGPKVITTGVFEQIKNNTYRITEIPIGKRMLSISKYKEFLEDLREKGTLKTILDHSTEEKVDFTVTSTTELNHLKLGLIDSISMGNMVLFDSNNKIKKYANVTEILEEYCTKRLELYSTRKDGQLKQMRHEERVLDNKIRFIQAILNETIVLKGKDEETLEKELDRLQFMRVDGKYDYLLSIQVRSMTSKRLADLQHELEQLRKAIKTLEKITPSDLWLQELKALEKEL